MLADSPQLPLGCYRLGFRGATGSQDFPGSAWRGALGYALRRLACLTGAPDCAGCPEIHRCAYAYVFDTPIPPGAAKMRRYTQAPHPFVLREVRTDAGVDLHLTLVGRSNAYLPLLVLALMQAAENPRGIAGHRLQLITVDQAATPGAEAWSRIDAANGTLTQCPPQCPVVPELAAAEIQLIFETPLRVKRAGGFTPAEVAGMDAFFEPSAAGNEAGGRSGRVDAPRCARSGVDLALAGPMAACRKEFDHGYGSLRARTGLIDMPKAKKLELRHDQPRQAH